MSVDDEQPGDDLPALPEPKNVALRGDECPQPEDAIENDRENRLVVSSFNHGGAEFVCFRERGGPLALNDSTPFLASTEAVTDLEKWV